MAMTLCVLVVFPPISPREAEALTVVSAAVTRARTRLTSQIFGCQEPDGEMGLAAEVSASLIGSAALCRSLRDPADVEDDR